MNPNSLIGTRCSCNKLQYKDIERIVAKNKDITNIPQLQKYIKCADRCNRCKGDISKIIDHYRKK